MLSYEWVCKILNVNWPRAQQQGPEVKETCVNEMSVGGKEQIVYRLQKSNLQNITSNVCFIFPSEV